MAAGYCPGLHVAIIRATRWAHPGPSQVLDTYTDTISRYMPSFSNVINYSKKMLLSPAYESQGHKTMHPY